MPFRPRDEIRRGFLQDREAASRVATRSRQLLLAVLSWLAPFDTEAVTLSQPLLAQVHSCLSGNAGFCEALES
jgi:hypothetical protein